VAYKRKNKSFYPDYLAEIIFSILICFEILLILALLFPPAIGRQIDFIRHYQPLPEWYFLWLYRLVRYLPGNLSFLTFLIPVITFFIFLLIPYIDRGKRGRLKAIIAGLYLLLFFFLLTFL
jgi:menaquinol-cytochrome c reductase cytochrome b/c subunit